MVIQYDKRPDATVDEKLQSLIESIMIAFDQVREDAKSIASESRVTAIGDSADDTVIVEDVTALVTASTGTVVSAAIVKWKNVTVFELIFKNSSSVNGGSNVFSGNLYNGWLGYDVRPIKTAMGAGYYGEHALVMTLSPSGLILVRNASSSAVTCSFNTAIRLTYITN